MPLAGEARARANGIEICYQSLGDPEAPAILLIMGLGMQLVAWPDAFCASLVEQGFRVIRFDNRDVGLSQRFDHLGVPNIAAGAVKHTLGMAVASPYRLADLADDTAALIDALGLQSAHVCGASMGGMVAQHLAARHPQRVRSLLLDSVIPNELILGTEHSVNLEDVLKAQLNRCRDDAECGKTFGDPYTDLRELAAQLRANPRMAPGRDPRSGEAKDQALTSGSLVAIARMFMYSSETAGLLPLTMDEATAGRFEPMLAQAAMMMIPEAWEQHSQMEARRRAFYEYHAAMLEPWDGPAAMVFTDGRQIGATLDRNGLRPARYIVTDDDLVVMASESGVLPIPESRIVKKWRLQPGKMFLIDFEQGRIIDDEELKNQFAFAKPYRLDDAGWVANRWCELLPITMAAKQKLMELEDPVIRLSLVDGYLRDKNVVVG